MSKRSAGRPQGARNVRPSKSEIRCYLELLREAAKAGDVRAASTLVQLHTAEQLTLKETAQ